MREICERALVLRQTAKAISLVMIFELRRGVEDQEERIDSAGYIVARSEGKGRIGTRVGRIPLTKFVPVSVDLPETIHSRFVLVESDQGLTRKQKQRGDE